jgi:hypothetical protein
MSRSLVTEQMVHDYHTQGFAVLRGLIPPSLLRDLRREAEKGLPIARAKGGPDAQRLQPIKNHEPLDLGPFRDWAELPELVDALQKLVAPDAWAGGPEHAMGVLYEPAERPWATAWHRDYGPFNKRIDWNVFRVMRTDYRYFHQINCALYADDSTWYVPGSFARDDFDAEHKICKDSPWQVGIEHKGTAEEAERHCIDYVRSMPRSVCLHLCAGDLGLYRSHGLHLGFYTPYKKRATLHDWCFTPQYKAALDRYGAGGWMEPDPVVSAVETAAR